MKEESIVLVYSTFPTVEEATRIGKILVEERLAACINILPCLFSYCHYEGSFEEGDKAVMFIKTTKLVYPSLEQKLRALHPYMVPCILSLPVDRGDVNFVNWISESVG